MESTNPDRMAKLPLVIAFMALLITIVGGYVRITDAGESCPDWPLCFGKFHPFTDADDQLKWWEDHPDEADSKHSDDPDHTYASFQIFSEWFHRFLAVLMALPILWNFLYVYKRKDVLGDRMYHLSIAAGILLLIQGAVGMLTVKYDNEDWTVALHLVLAVTFISILLWQWLAWEFKIGKKWGLFELPPEYLSANKRLLQILTASVLTLLALGAWVSSTASGSYNSACSIGYSTGWPKCQGELLPVIETMGVLVQMVHRFGAILVGAILIWGGTRLRKTTRDFGLNRTLSLLVDTSTLLWLCNVLIGGFYIISADADGFLEWLSLLHLLFGVATFLVLVVAELTVYIVLEGPQISLGEEQ